LPDLTPTVIDPELRERLGQIVIRWASADAWISALLATIAHADPGAMTLITNNVSASTQSRWIRGLLAFRKNEAVAGARVKKLLARADELRGRRNELIHGLWDSTGCEPKTAQVQTINLERSEPLRMRLVTVKELDQLVVQIDNWIADYIKLGRELGFPRRFGQTKSIFDED
jgi:hypothetical protein